MDAARFLPGVSREVDCFGEKGLAEDVVTERKKVKELRAAEREARRVLRDMGIEKPTEGQIAMGIIAIVENWKKERPLGRES